MALIRREDVWALVGDHAMTVRPGSKLEWVIHHYANAIDGAPEVEAVQVVYCGECKYMLPDRRCCAFADDCIRPSTSDYCSRGERRDGE